MTKRKRGYMADRQIVGRITMTHRSLLSHLWRFAREGRQHYRQARARGNGRALAIAAAWVLSGLVLKIGRA